MLDAVAFDLDQKFDLGSAQQLATLPRASFDVYTKGIVGLGRWYRGFKCTDLGTGQLSVGPGEIYIDGVVYASTQEQRVNLLAKGPSILRQKFAVYVYGQEQLTDPEPTTFLLDSANRTTTGRTKPRLSSRVASVDALGGNISADPQPPSLGDIPSSKAVVVAYVTMDPSTIIDNGVMQNALAVLPSTVEARTRLDGVDVWRSSVGATIDALGSTVAGISTRLGQVPTANFVLQLAQDIGRIKSQLKLPQNFTSYGNDHYLDESQSDTDDTYYLAHIEEGVRFPMANQATFQLGLLNPYDDSVVQIANMLFPKFDLKTSLSVTDHDDTYIANQYQFQTVAFTQLSMNRVRYRVGPYYTICTNWFWFVAGGGTYDQLTGIFTLFSGEMYQIYDDDKYLMSSFTSSTVHISVPLRVRQVWYDGVTSEPYTAAFPVNNTVSGALSGNTFVCPQDGWLPQLNLFFADKAAAGDVTVILSQVPDNGQPILTSQIGMTTIKVADIKISTPVNKAPTPANFAPLVAMQKGKRYAVQIVSAGAHTLWRSRGNKLANGSFFVSTDQAWALGDPDKDLCMELVFAKFRSPTVPVELNAINLDGGICNIDVLAQQYAPSGTKLSYRVMVAGVWTDIDSFVGPVSPLNGLPAQLRLQALFVGTTDMMPGLGVASNSRITVSRPRTDYRYVTEERTLPPGQTANRVILTYRLEWWRGASHHTMVPGIRTRTSPTGAFTFSSTPTSISDIPAPDDPDNAIIRTVVFDFRTTPITGFKEDFRGTTDSPVACYHGAEADWVALTV